MYLEQAINSLYYIESQSIVLTDEVTKTMQKRSLTHRKLVKRGVVNRALTTVNEHFTASDDFGTTS